ncbi:MAG: TIGR04211 family SH3 domain-containing protein [Gammaproteobacteria bacterium]|nr:TIGR04211 family SH3 domain-containing protein [Gammaproteobacteria bacterium]
MRFLIAVLLLAALPVAVIAETAYVTDILRLGLHKAEDTSDRAFRTLQSGQEMEILNRGRNYAEVRLPDGTLGYVKVAYLVADKPAKLIVTETQAANTELERKLADLNAAFSQPAATISALEQERSEMQAELTDATSRIDSLQEINDDLVAKQGQYKYSLPITWVGGALAVCLLAGFLGGLWWTDQRSRKRHGGIRIY